MHIESSNCIATIFLPHYMSYSWIIPDGLYVWFLSPNKLGKLIQHSPTPKARFGNPTLNPDNMANKKAKQYDIYLHGNQAAESPFKISISHNDRAIFFAKFRFSWKWLESIRHTTIGLAGALLECHNTWSPSQSEIFWTKVGSDSH